MFFKFFLVPITLRWNIDVTKCEASTNSMKQSRTLIDFSLKCLPMIDVLWHKLHPSVSETHFLRDSNFNVEWMNMKSRPIRMRLKSDSRIDSLLRFLYVKEQTNVPIYYSSFYAKLMGIMFYGVWVRSFIRSIVRPFQIKVLVMFFVNTLETYYTCSL